MLPGFFKSFSPGTIGPGSVSTLRFDIDNSKSGSPVDNLAFSDTLPAGMTLATPAGAFTNCGDAVLSAPDGGTTVTFANARLGANSSCRVTVNVVGGAAGTLTNVSGDLTSSAGNSGSASADLVVSAGRPGFTKSFAPATVALGTVSTLTLTIDNTANQSAADFLAFTDPLPIGLAVASPANAATSCSGGQIPPTLTAVPGASSIALNFGFVAAMSTCSVAVDVVASLAGRLGNLTGELSSSPAGSSGRAAAVLTVVRDFLGKTFTDDPVPPGGTVNLRFTVTNFDATNAATAISFTDNLNAVLSGLVAVGLPLADPCGSGSTLTGTSLLTLSGGNLAPQASCTFNVTLQVPGAAANGTYTNTTSVVSLILGGAPTTRPAASDNLVVQPVPRLTKTFTDDPVAGGGSVTLEFTITNTSAASSATNIAFTDDLDAVIPGLVPTLPPTGFCGPGSMIFLSGGALMVTGANLGPAASCTFSVTLQLPAGVAGGLYPNTTSAITADVGGTPLTGKPASDTLEVLGPPRLSKSFTDDPVLPGGNVTLEFTLTYGANATASATAIAFSDDLNAVVPGLAAVGLPANNVCGAGSQISGTTNLSFTGGSLAPGTSCTFSVTLQVPAAAVPGTYTNTTGDVSATVGGQAVTGNQAVDTLRVGGLSFTKSFTDDPVAPGNAVTLRFSVQNQSAVAAATNMTFTDDLNAVVPGLAAVGLPASGVCGMGSQISGTTALTLTGGNLAPGASCTFDVTLQVPASAPAGEFLNVTSALSADVGGSPATGERAVDRLIVAGALSIAKAFTDDPALPGGTVTLQFTLANGDPTQAATALAFSDDLNAVFPGLAALGLPANDVCGVGSQINGAGLLTFTGGSLAPGATCVFSVTLQVPAALNSNVTNTTSAVTGMVGGVSVSGNAASDVLQIAVADLGVAHTLEQTDPVAPNGTLAYRLLVVNNGPGEAPNVRLADLLPAGTTFVSSSPGAPLCGASAGSLNCNLGTFAPGASTNVDVMLTVDQATSGVVTNTASVDSDAADGALANNTSVENTTVKFVKGDFNYDARTDLVVYKGATNQTDLWLMDGSVRQGLQTLSPPLGASQVVGGTDDFTGDRRTDLALRDLVTGAIEFWPLNGATLSGAPVPLTGAMPLPLEWRIVASADFNSDGKPDLLWNNMNTRQLLVWTLNGTQFLGQITPVPDQAVDANWRVIAALDFNGDLRPDLLWYNLTSGRIVLWFMDANVMRTMGIFAAPPSAGDANWKVLVGGDYGLGPMQNGVPVPNSNDIVWRNETSGRFVVWHMNLAGMRTGGAFTTPAEPAPPATGWTLVGPR